MRYTRIVSIFPLGIVLLTSAALMAGEVVQGEVGYPRTVADIAYPPTASMVIIRVPDYLYANAAYEVPITFEFGGLGSNVFIKDLTISFFADGQRLDFPSPPFARDDGTGLQNNGMDLRYTAWLPIQQFRRIRLPLDRPISDTCYFVARARAARADTSGEPTDELEDVESRVPQVGNATAARPLAFGDKRIAVVDIGNAVSLDLRQVQQSTFRTSQLGSQGLFLSYHPILAATAQVAQTEAQLRFHGFNITADQLGVSEHYPSLGNEIMAYARIDSRGALSDLGHVGKAEINQHGVGVYWAVSYRATSSVLVLPERRKGMALDRTDGSFTLTYGNGAHEIFYIKGSSSIGDLYRSSLGEVMTLAQAAAIIFPQFSLLQWAIRTGGTMRTIISAVEAIREAIDDEARPADAASATITHLLLLKRNTSGGSVETRVIRKSEHRRNAYSRERVGPDSQPHNFNVGDTFQYHVDVEVAAQVNKRVWFSDYSSAQAGYHHLGLPVKINSSN